MKIGLQSSLYNKLTLQEEIKTALSNKVDFFDIFFDTWDPSDIPEETYNFIDEINKRKIIDFTIHLPINFYDLDKSKQDLFYKFISYIKPKTITIHFNTLSYDLLQELVLTAGKNNSVLCVENTIPDFNDIYKCNYISYMKKAKKILQKKEIDNFFGATIDTGHSFVNGIMPEKYIKELSKNNIKTATVHLHDNDGTKDSHQPMGTGKINFSVFFDELENQKQNPYFVIEHWNEFKTSLDYYNKLINKI